MGSCSRAGSALFHALRFWYDLVLSSEHGCDVGGEKVAVPGIESRNWVSLLALAG